MTTFSPVTETEMTEFSQNVNGMFGRLATTLVGYSQQAKEVETLKQDLQAHNDRLTALSQDNARLQTEARDNHELASVYERERDQANRDLGASKAAAQALQDAMIGRDATVSELRQSLSRTLDQLNARNRENEDLTASNTGLKEDRDYWRREADSYKDQLHEAKDKLSASEASLKSIREAHEKVFAAFKPPQSDPVPQPAQDTVQTVFPEAQKPFEYDPQPAAEPWKPSIEMKPVLLDEAKQADGSKPTEMPDWLNPKT